VLLRREPVGRPYNKGAILLQLLLRGVYFSRGAKAVFQINNRDAATFKKMKFRQDRDCEDCGDCGDCGHVISN